MAHKLGFSSLLIIFAMCLLPCSFALAGLPHASAGLTLESYSEVFYGGRSSVIRQSPIKVPQIFGISMRPKEISKPVKAGGKAYFVLQAENMGNGTDRVMIQLEAPSSSVKAVLVADSNQDGIHQSAEAQKVPAVVTIGEGAVYTFFLEIDAPTNSRGSRYLGTISASSSERDGSEYTGYNGVSYGGPDKVLTSISISVE